MKFIKYLQQFLLIFLLSCCFFGCYYLLYSLFRTTALGLLSIVLVSYIAWKRGVLSALLLTLLNTFWMGRVLLMITPELASPIPTDAFIAFGIHIVISFLGGYIGNLSRRLQREVNERKKAESLLKTYQKELEIRVETRTRELEAANEKLHKAEKLEAIGQLAGGIAHDFNNHITIMLGYLDLLLKELNKESLGYNYTQQVQASAQRASELTSQLLAFARREKYNLQLIDCNYLVHEVATLLSRSVNKNITIKHHKASDLPHVRGGISQIHNAILNLALNACDAMEQGGMLTLATACIQVTSEYCETHAVTCAPGAYVGISVSDNGCGIAPEVLPHIFEPFYTTKEKGKGTGMGLAAVYGIAQSHNGTIIVESAVGEGTTFTLLLPTVGFKTPSDNPTEE